MKQFLPLLGISGPGLAALLGLAACAGLSDPEALVTANGEPCATRNVPAFGRADQPANACLTKKEWRVASSTQSEKNAYADSRRNARQNLAQPSSPPGNGTP